MNTGIDLDSLMPFSGKRDLVGARQTSNSCIVLQYSRVALLSHDPLQLAVQPCTFERQMEYLAENCTVLPIDGMVDCLEHGKPLPPRSVVLVFDGGYAELLYIVQEVLERLDLHAAAFVPSSMFVDNLPMWYEELEDLLIANDLCNECEIQVADRRIHISTRTQYERLAAYDQLVSLLAHQSPVRQRGVLNALHDSIGYAASEVDNHRRLQVHELKRLDEGGRFCIGSSTHHHVNPNGLTPGQQLAEFSKNKEILEEILGHPVEYCSWPFWSIGGPCPTTSSPVGSLGFRAMCWNSPGIMSLRTMSDWYEFTRIPIGERSLFRFHQRLAMPAVS